MKNPSAIFARGYNVTFYLLLLLLFWIAAQTCSFHLCLIGQVVIDWFYASFHQYKTAKTFRISLQNDNNYGPCITLKCVGPEKENEGFFLLLSFKYCFGDSVQILKVGRYYLLFVLILPLYNQPIPVQHQLF